MKKQCSCRIVLLFKSLVQVGASTDSSTSMFVKESYSYWICEVVVLKLFVAPEELSVENSGK